jgi:hypothetical protein
MAAEGRQAPGVGPRKSRCAELRSAKQIAVLSRLIQNGIDERPFDRRRHVGVDYDKIERTASIGVSDLLPIGLTVRAIRTSSAQVGAVTLISSALERRVT